MAVQEFSRTEIVSRTNVNQRINQINSQFPVSIANGGTGSTSVSGARIALGIETKTVLYNNASGSNDTIYLYDYIDFYSSVDVVWCHSSNTFSSRIPITDTVVNTRLASTVRSSLNEKLEIFWYMSRIQLSGNCITWSNYGYGDYNFNDNTRSWGTGNAIKITNVFGYKI